MALIDGKSDGLAMAALAAGAAGIGALFWSSRSTDDEQSEQPDQVEGANGSERLAINHFHRRRIRRYRRAAKVYTGWSLANVVGSAIGIANTSGSWRRFFEINGVWSAVGVAFGTAVHYAFGRRASQEHDRVSAIDAAERTEKLTLADGTASLATASMGAYLWNRGTKIGSKRLEGYGPALVFQGTVAALFDGVVYQRSSSHREQFEAKLAASAPRLENRSSPRG